MNKFLKLFISILLAISLLITSEVCSAQDYYYAQPSTSYSVGSAEIIVGVLVVGAIVAGVALLATHHHHDDPDYPYLSFYKWAIPDSPMYVDEDPQVLNYIVDNTRGRGTDIIVDGYYDSLIVRNHHISYDCGDYLPGNSSCNIQLIVYPDEPRQIRRNLVVTDQAGFSISRPINIDVYPDANKPLKVAIPHISNMTINKDKSQTLDYVLTNNSNRSLDISKIEGFHDQIIRDNSIEGNCGTTLAADSSCKLRLRIDPTNPEEISQQLIIGHGTTNDFVAPINLFVHALDIVYKQSTPVLYALPNQTFNDGKVTIKNYYTKPVKTDAIIRPVNGVELKFLATTCGDALAPNASCEYQLQYQTADSNKLKLGNSDRPFVTGVNSAIDIKYTLENKNYYLKFPVQTFLPSDSRILNYPLNTTAYNSLPSNNITQKVKIGDVLYAATADKGLAISKDNGISWKTYTIGNGLGSDHVNAVTANENGSNIYVATDNGLAISNDFGATWKNYNKLSSLGSDKITAVTVSRDGATITVTTTDHGVIISTNGGESWKATK